MRIFTVLLLLALGFLSCNYDDFSGDACPGVNSPTDLPWLKGEIQEIEQGRHPEYTYVTQTQYLGHTIFIFPNCCPNCNSIIPAFNCSGELIGYLGYNEGDVPFDVLVHDVVIWKPANSVCRF